MLVWVAFVYLLQGTFLAQAVIAMPEDFFSDADLGIPTPFHHDIMRRNVNYTIACSPPVKRITGASGTCAGLHGCGGKSQRRVLEDFR